MNFSVSGYGSSQELILYEEEVLHYKPDLVILAFFPLNDISDNHPQLKKNAHFPYFELRSGELILNNSFLKNKRFLWETSSAGKIALFSIDHSRILQVMNRIRKILKKNRHLRAKDHLTNPEIDWVLEHPIYSPPEDPVWIEAWAITEALIRQIHRRVRQENSLFVMSILSDPIQVHPNSALRESLKQELPVKDLYYPNRRLEALGKEAGFPVISLAEEMNAALTYDQDYVHGFDNAKLGNGHWNERGHSLAATILAKKLSEIIPSLG